MNLIGERQRRNELWHENDQDFASFTTTGVEDGSRVRFLLAGLPMNLLCVCLWLRLCDCARVCLFHVFSVFHSRYVISFCSFSSTSFSIPPSFLRFPLVLLFLLLYRWTKYAIQKPKECSLNKDLFIVITSP